MPSSETSNQNSPLHRLSEPRPLVAVELRPPPTGLSFTESSDTWIGMYHATRRLAGRDTLIFLTDNAVGEAEEENLRHLTTNLAQDTSPTKLVPILTCKHSLDYCFMYVTRAASHGFGALTVLGGDKAVGPPRCVDHAYQLRQQIRERAPSLALGGWANPNRDPEKQVDFLLDEGFAADFYLTQVVSHYGIEAVKNFLEVARKRDLPYPGVFGVFYYRSANPKTLSRLSSYFPVPAEEITHDFDSGLSAEQICARTIKRLRDIGADKVYVSNLGVHRAESRYRSIMAALAEA